MDERGRVSNLSKDGKMPTLTGKFRLHRQRCAYGEDHPRVLAHQCAHCGQFACKRCWNPRKKMCRPCVAALRLPPCEAESCRHPNTQMRGRMKCPACGKVVCWHCWSYEVKACKKCGKPHGAYWQRYYDNLYVEKRRKWDAVVATAKAEGAVV